EATFAVLWLHISAGAVGGVWKTRRPPCFFAVRPARGEPTAEVGTVTPAFLRRVREVAEEHGVAAGRVWGEIRRGGRISLRFSGQFPESARQQLRNWWAVSGWTAGTRRRSV